jgi:hypothetical protein
MTVVTTATMTVTVTVVTVGQSHQRINTSHTLCCADSFEKFQFLTRNFNTPLSPRHTVPLSRLSPVVTVFYRVSSLAIVSTVITVTTVTTVPSVITGTAVTTVTTVTHHCRHWYCHHRCHTVTDSDRWIKW